MTEVLGMGRIIRTDSGLVEIRAHEQWYLPGGCGKRSYASWTWARYDARAINAKQNGSVLSPYRCADPECRGIHIGRDITVGSPSHDRGGEIDEQDLDDLTPECVRAIRHAERRRRAA